VKVGDAAGRLTIRMENLERLTLAKMELLLRIIGRFATPAKSRRWRTGLSRDVKEQGYRQLSKGQKGIVRPVLGQDHGAEPSAGDTAARAMDEPQAADDRTGAAAPVCAAL